MASAGDFRFDVPIIEQEDGEACWAAAIEAMCGYARQTVTQSEIRQVTGIAGGIPLKEGRVRDVLKLFGMSLAPLRRYSATEIYDLAGNYGPLWVAIDYGGAFWGAFHTGPNPNHILVLMGGSAAEDDRGNVSVSDFELLDPWAPAKTRTLVPNDLLGKMTSLSSKTQVNGHWIGHFTTRP